MVKTADNKIADWWA